MWKSNEFQSIQNNCSLNQAIKTNIIQIQLVCKYSIPIINWYDLLILHVKKNSVILRKFIYY